MLGILLPTRRKNEAKNLGRKYLELSERRRPFLWKKRRAKRADKKSVRKKHKAAGARSRLDDLPFSTFNVRTEAVNKVHESVKSTHCWDPGLHRVVALLGCKRPKETELSKPWPLDNASTLAVLAAGSKAEKGNMGLDW